MYLYESHMGGLYTSEDELDYWFIFKKRDRRIK